VKRDLSVPTVLDRVFARADAALFVSISGGKDGQAMLATIAETHRSRGWACALFAIHADLGRPEWKESLPHCQKLCDDLRIYLKIVRRPQGDLLQEIQDRQAKLTGTGRSAWPTTTQRYCTADQKRDQLNKAKRQPFWPDAQNRYCTSDQKRAQIDKALRPYSLVISAMGMRAGESRARAKKPALSIDPRLTAKVFRSLGFMDALDAWIASDRSARLAFDWLPIHEWTAGDVWVACGTSAEDLARRQALYRNGDTEQALVGWPAHPAYVFGNERVSCALCILASRSDLRVGALHNPDLYRTYVQMERESGFTFQHKKPLSDIAPELLDEAPAA
jgi:3'-phosphoadenosine 5'-phosphosulfate sulfotransferase (PAPS reductase)/FAD synthetase